MLLLAFTNLHRLGIVLRGIWSEAANHLVTRLRRPSKYGVCRYLGAIGKNLKEEEEIAYQGCLILDS